METLPVGRILDDGPRPPEKRGEGGPGAFGDVLRDVFASGRDTARDRGASVQDRRDDPPTPERDAAPSCQVAGAHDAEAAGERDRPDDPAAKNDEPDTMIAGAAGEAGSAVAAIGEADSAGAAIGAAGAAQAESPQTPVSTKPAESPAPETATTGATEAPGRTPDWAAREAPPPGAARAASAREHALHAGPPTLPPARLPDHAVAAGLSGTTPRDGGAVPNSGASVPASGGMPATDSTAVAVGDGVLSANAAPVAVGDGILSADAAPVAVGDDMPPASTGAVPGSDDTPPADTAAVPVGDITAPAGAEATPTATGAAVPSDGAAPVADPTATAAGRANPPGAAQAAAPAAIPGSADGAPSVAAASPAPPDGEGDSDRKAEAKGDSHAATPNPARAGTAQPGAANGAPQQPQAQAAAAPDAARERAAQALPGDTIPDAADFSRADLRHGAAGGMPSSNPAGSPLGEPRMVPTLSAQTDAATARPMPPAVVQQVAIQISRAMQDGQDRLTLELKPAELGRVSVRLEIGHDNRVIAVIAADRADTLDLLQRDARLLERALNNAGLRTDSGSLSFDLHGQGAGEREPDGNVPPPRPAAVALVAEAAVVQAATAMLANGAGVNIQV